MDPTKQEKLPISEPLDYEEGSSQKCTENHEESSCGLSREEDRRLVRRIDMCLLPIMAVSYAFQFLDKSALSYTSILGLRDDLNVSGSQFSWSSSIYYFGYLVASYPAGLLMVRFPVGKTIAASIVVWGAVLMFTALCSNHAGLWANRLFLGVSEAAIAPGLAIVVSMWYKRSEQPMRHAAWFLGNTFAGIVGGVLAYGIGRISTIAPWKAVFLIFGATTVTWSVGIFFLLPDEPGNAWFLSKADRQKAVIRVQENLTGIKSNAFQWHQCLEAITDVNAWLYVLIQLSGQIANGGVQSFGSIVIAGMGFSTFTTLLIQIIAYVFQLIFVVIAMVGSTYLHNTRTLWIVFDMLCAIAGAVMVRQIDAHHKWGRFFGYCMTMGYTPNFPIILSLFSANTGGFTKKMTINAMIFIAYCAGNIIGPQLFFEKEAPSYTSGFLAIMICYAFGLVMSLVLRFHLKRENRRRDALCGPLPASDARRVLNDDDKTDKEIEEFRYVY